MFSVNDSIKFYEYMYHDATIYLDRKYNIFKQFIQNKENKNKDVQRL